MRRFLAATVIGITVTGSVTADLPPRYPWQKRRENRPIPKPEPQGEKTADPSPAPESAPPRRSGLCSWLPVVGLTAAPLTLGFWLARRNRRPVP